jgi:hypothetical protein
VTNAKVVRCHCGGTVKGYPYVRASVFAVRTTDGGRRIWYNTGVGVTKSTARGAEREGRALAEKLGVPFQSGYGSLHNTPAPRDKVDFDVFLIQ